MEYTLKQSNDYLITHAGRINMQYRPRYHFAPPVGWMNDPNGVCYFRGAMHVFYQYYPYDTCWGPMHWGHAYTQDNCVFHHCKVALAPDCADESGCFSGGAIVKDDGGELVLMYTKHYETAETRRETQGMACSSDGVHFSKREAPVIGTADLPEGVCKQDFRDPNPVLIGGEYFIFVGSKSEAGEGLILVYSSRDGKNFRYRNKICSPYFGEMGECPDFFTLDGKDVLLVSAVRVKEEENRFKGCNSSLYLLGKFDPETCEFRVEHSDEIDCGHDFYAPQTCSDGEGRRIMVAWMEMWGKEYFLHKFRHGYNGALTYPRALSVRNGLLYQAPAPGVEKYRRRTDFSQETSKCLDFTVHLAEGGCVGISRADCAEDRICFGLRGGRVYVDASRMKNAPQGVRVSKYAYGREVRVRVLMDVSSLEIFADDGKETFTERHYFDSEKVRVTAENARCEECYELDVPQEDFTILG